MTPFTARQIIRHRACTVAFAAALLTGCGGVQTSSVASAQQTPTGTPVLNYRGAYSAQTSYAAGDVVYFQGASYVAIAANSGIAPLGANASAADWGHLADQGAKGDTGLQGIAGLQGAPGPAGPAGVAGAVGAIGPKGDKGDIGPVGPVGPSGPNGQAGPAGPQGIPGTAGSFLAGKRFGVQGDSISSAFNNQWQNVVATRTGMTLVYQDAVAGRVFSGAFACYGAASGGQPLFPFKSDPTVCPSAAGTDGNTLAQNVANLDILIIDLGTNDLTESLGQLGDPAGSNTFYGLLRWVVETYQKANPALRVVLVTPQYNSVADPATVKAMADAMVSYGEANGIPTINMFAKGGVNAITQSTLTRDGTHPSDFGFANFYGPVIAQGLQQIF